MFTINSKDLKFASDIRVLERNERVILYSIKYSAWIKISRDDFCLITKIMENQAVCDQRGKKLLEILKKFRVVQDKNNDIDITIYKRKKLNSLYIFLTRKCNMACEFCSMNSGPTIETKDEISLDDTLKFLENINDISINRVILSGGEPLLSDKLEKVIDYVYKNMKSKIIIQTNGIMINEIFCKKVAQKVNKINISIESINDIQLGKESVLIDKIAEIHNYGIDMEFSFVVTAKNMNSIYRFIDLCVEYNAEINIKLVSSVRDEKKYKSLCLDEEQVLRFYYSIFKYVIKQGYDKLNNIKGIIEYSPIPREGCSAYEGNILALMPEGNCYPCHSVVGDEFKICNTNENIFDSNFKINKKAIFNIDSKIYCRQCDLKHFCGGPCSSEMYTSIEKSENKPASCEYKKILIEYYLWEYTKGLSLREQLEYTMNKIEEVCIKKKYNL